MIMARTSVTTRKNTSSNAAGKSKTAAVQKINSSEKSFAGSSKASGAGVDRHQMITVAAYYMAEQRGFKGGDPVADWLAAEAKIDAMLKKSGVVLIH
jgi:hypothetical protein